MIRSIRFMPVAALLTGSAAIAAETQAVGFTPEQQATIGKIASDYLVQHPEVLIKVSQELQAKQRTQQQELMTNAVTKLQKQLMEVKGIPVLGPDNAKVTVTEFFDYQCIYCSHMALTVESLIKNNPDVKFIFRDWPIFATHWKNSDIAALTGLNVYAQSGAKAYLRYHNGIYATGHYEGKLSTDDIALVAAKALKAAPTMTVSDNDYKVTVGKNDLLAQGIGISGTPAFIIMPAQNATAKTITVASGATTLDALQAAINRAE